MKKDYCSGFPEGVCGADISECCKKHDNDCGMAGSFNFVKHQIEFYVCVRSKVSVFMAFAIAFGGALLCLLKSPWLIYKKIKYRITVDRDSVKN
ncbi:MAG: hypothetical protein PHV10_07645 [Sulfuricurvum sp.]|nr:hypothetical protein [Sulfuricurvum sp.]